VTANAAVLAAVAVAAAIVVVPQKRKGLAKNLLNL